MDKDVFVSRTRDFLREIARLNKKATRIGVPQIVALDNGKVSKTRHIVTKDEDGNENVRSIPMEVQHYTLTLPELADCPWEAIVKITPLEGSESFAEAMPAGTQADADAYKGADAQNCDHCHARRARSVSYVVRHKADKRVMQLGRNCFEDYVGKDTLRALEFQSVIMQNLGGDEDGYWPMDGGIRQIPVAKLEDCVAYAEMLRRTEGWVNNVRNPLDGSLDVEGTHRIAGRRIQQVGTGHLPSKIMDAIIDADRDTAAFIVSRMRDIEVSDEFGQTLQNLSDYEWIPARKASLAAYMGQFLLNIDRKASEARLNATRVYVGTVGERRVFENLTCVRTSTIETDFGSLYINIFHDADKNVIVWKTGSYNFANDSKPEDKFTLIGTIKAHEDYRDTKQTILSRCKQLDAAALEKLRSPKKARKSKKATEPQMTAEQILASRPAPEPKPFCDRCGAEAVNGSIHHYAICSLEDK